MLGSRHKTKKCNPPKNAFMNWITFSASTFKLISLNLLLIINLEKTYQTIYSEILRNMLLE